MHWELTHCYHQVMRLMVPTLHHNPHKTERLEFGEPLSLVRCDRELHTIW
jgi:hypothetical protein